MSRRQYRLLFAGSVASVVGVMASMPSEDDLAVQHRGQHGWPLALVWVATFVVALRLIHLSQD